MNSDPQLANVLVASGTLDPTRALTEIHLADGRVLRLDTATLSDVPLASPPPRPASTGAMLESISIPLVEEFLTVDTRTVETGTVRLQKTIQEYTENLNEPLAVHTYDMERVILNDVVDALPCVRTEGETTIYPLVEEQLVLTKRLILKEEVRVTRRHAERRDTRAVTLRREHLSVEREPRT